MIDINLRQTHPGLYHSIMTVGIIHLGLAANFWYYTPTFNPYDINKNVIGAVFFGLGICQLIFLNIFRNLSRIRLTLAVSIWFTFFWGIANTQQGFAGKSSMQLPIWCLGVCLLQIPTTRSLLFLQTLINITLVNVRKPPT